MLWQKYTQTITQISSHIDKMQRRDLLVYLVSFSMLIAAWVQYLQHGWITADSVLYLEQARLFVTGEWNKIFAVFNWPLYGISIGLVSKLTHLGIHQSAQLLSMLFFGLSTFSFLWLIQLLGGTNRTICFGAGLLFSSLYIVGDGLEMFIRGHGFWAFYLTAVAYFIRYIQTKKISYALAWQTSMMIATLYRIEAIVYLILLPIVYISFCGGNMKTRVYALFNSYSLGILVTIVISMSFMLYPDTTMSQFGRLDEVFSYKVFDMLTAKLIESSNIMADQVLGVHLDQYAFIGILLTFIYVLIVKTISTTGLITFILAIVGIKQFNRNHQPIAYAVLLSTLAVAALIACLIIIKVFVLSGRYLIGLTWILLLFASLELTRLSYKKSKRNRVIFILIICCIVLCLIKNTIPKRSGYNYQQQAVAWVKSQATPHASIYYDEARMRYYAGAPFIRSGVFWKDLRSEALALEHLNYQYLIINIKRREQEKIAFIKNTLSQYQEVQRFYAPAKKKYCAIFKKISD